MPPFIGREEGRLGRFNNSSIQPTDQTGRARETAPAEPEARAVDVASVDAELEAIAPGCGLTFAAIVGEVEGRVDLSRVDVVQAVRDTLGRAKDRVKRPAGYVAAVIVRKPDAWPLGGGTSAYDPTPKTDPSVPSRAAGCAAGDHDWGPEKWGETMRDRCLDCDERRADVDRVFWVDPVTDVSFTFLATGLVEESYAWERHQRYSDLVHGALLP